MFFKNVERTNDFIQYCQSIKLIKYVFFPYKFEQLIVKDDIKEIINAEQYDGNSSLN